MDKDLQQKMLDYIDALEQVNEQLVFALKKCVELLAHPLLFYIRKALPGIALTRDRQVLD